MEPQLQTFLAADQDKYKNIIQHGEYLPKLCVGYFFKIKEYFIIFVNIYSQTLIFPLAT